METINLAMTLSAEGRHLITILTQRLSPSIEHSESPYISVTILEPEHAKNHKINYIL